jgi:hypothetical protein
MGRLFFRYNNNKIAYYLVNYLRPLIPRFLYRARLKKKLGKIKNHNSEYISERVNYYNKLISETRLSDKATSLGEFSLIKKYKTYSFDTYKYIRFFNPSLKAKFIFGDITTVPDEPGILKSRPIDVENSNSVLLKLNRIRHYIYINDRMSFSEKKDMLVFRGTRKQEHRIRFMKMYIDHPMCDIGTFITDSADNSLYKGWMSKKKQLEYKFVLCLEGFDVSSNLKWVMSSNSIAVMPKPKYETWFMEGKLIPDQHYILIKDDYSDLEEKLKYYIMHPEESLKIISNANAYMNQFRDREREDLISLMVLEKYFIMTGQETNL